MRAHTLFVDNNDLVHYTIIDLFRDSDVNLISFVFLCNLSELIK